MAVSDISIHAAYRRLVQRAHRTANLLRTKVFCFFFSKKKRFLPLPYFPSTPILRHAACYKAATKGVYGPHQRRA
jgi:hypothetical protein